MTYIVTENCIKCKFQDCVEVCPVDCFYEGENFLVIHPDECIDCGVCEPECPAEAILPDTEPGIEKWLEINTKFASIWPKITRRGISCLTPKIGTANRTRLKCSVKIRARATKPFKIKSFYGAGRLFQAARAALFCSAKLWYDPLRK